MHNNKIVIAGGTGFIGQALAAYFGKDNDIIILGRHVTDEKLLRAADGYRIQYLAWDGLRVEKSWTQAIDGCDLLVNLAGKSVNCRYTSKNKQAIFDSRTDSTRALGLAVRDAVTPPKLWINAASATIYRHAEDRPQDEHTGDIENDFSVQVCKEWEEVFEQQRAPFTRKVILRIAITLGNGGVIMPYLRLLKFGLGGRQGNGRQMYSWVHIEDLCRAIKWIYERKQLEGTYNVCSPHPVTNREFMRAMRRATGHRIGLPAFKWMLKLGAWLIGTEPELILKSRWVLPTKLQDAGFLFRYIEAEDAIKAVLAKIPRGSYHLL
jgi:uncharacterized protein (TIGR01777 family)